MDDAIFKFAVSGIMAQYFLAILGNDLPVIWMSDLNDQVWFLDEVIRWIACIEKPPRRRNNRGNQPLPIPANRARNSELSGRVLR